MDLVLLNRVFLMISKHLNAVREVRLQILHGEYKDIIRKISVNLHKTEDQISFIPAKYISRRVE
jgi:hypothetical protein